MESTNLWKSGLDVLADFENLCDFYDPKKEEKWKTPLKLPVSTRGRMVDESDTESDHEIENPTDIPSSQEYHQQIQACCLDYSNNVIEDNWCKKNHSNIMEDSPVQKDNNLVGKNLHKNDSRKEDPEVNLIATNGSLSNKPFRRRITYDSPTFINDDTSLRDSSFEVSNTFNSHAVSIEENTSNNSTDLISNTNELMNEFNDLTCKSDEESQVNSSHSIYEYYSSDDENIIVSVEDIEKSETPSSRSLKDTEKSDSFNTPPLSLLSPKDIDKSDTSSNTTSCSSSSVKSREKNAVSPSTNSLPPIAYNKSKKKSKKYTPINVEIHVTKAKLEESQAPVKESLLLSSSLNPNAREFVSYMYPNHYQIHSREEFPPLS